MGAKNYEALGAEIGRLVASKQEAYGDSFGKSDAILKVLFPSGVPVESYSNLLAIVRVIDKLFRVATANDKTGEDPWRDIAGYGLLGTGAPSSGGASWIEKRCRSCNFTHKASVLYWNDPLRFPDCARCGMDAWVEISRGNV